MTKRDEAGTLEPEARKNNRAGVVVLHDILSKSSSRFGKPVCEASDLQARFLLNGSEGGPKEHSRMDGGVNDGHIRMDRRGLHEGEWDLRAGEASRTAGGCKQGFSDNVPS